MIDPTIWLSPAIAVLICYFYHLFARAKVIKLTEITAYYNDKVEKQAVIIAEKKKDISALEAKVKELEKQKPKVDAKELVDFMVDLKANGYGVVRIDPDSIFYRGSR